MLFYLCQKQEGGLRLSWAEGVYCRWDGYRQKATVPPQGWALSEYAAGWALADWMSDPKPDTGAFCSVRKCLMTFFCVQLPHLQTRL